LFVRLLVAVANQLQSFSFCFPLFVRSFVGCCCKSASKFFFLFPTVCSFVCWLLLQISFRGFVLFVFVGELLTAASLVVVAFHHTAAAP
jgi:hypothetical protein